jgi:hypothetical protein
MPAERFSTTRSDWSSVPIRNLGLTIAGTRLEPILKEFQAELEAAGIRRLRPSFYLSSKWGVPFDTVSVAIPFYLAHPELVQLHEDRAGHVEGFDRADILRYLRHEMGHVVNYAYKLYEQEEWTLLFGSIDKEYEEEYHPQPFSGQFVWHLPGWYAQKHPDENWAEIFAVWLTPGRDWRAEYADRPVALAKLEYCDRTLARLRDVDPLVTATELDEDVGALAHSLDEFYGGTAAGEAELPRGLDGALRTVFGELGLSDKRRPASGLIRRLESELMATVYRWTGHFPERTRGLLRHLAPLADELHLGYPEDREVHAMVAVTTLVAALAMNHVHRRQYFG